jgi:hypothetical protein
MRYGDRRFSRSTGKITTRLPARLPFVYRGSRKPSLRWCRGIGILARPTFPGFREIMGPRPREEAPCATVNRAAGGRSKRQAVPWRGNTLICCVRRIWHGSWPDRRLFDRRPREWPVTAPNWHRARDPIGRELAPKRFYASSRAGGRLKRPCRRGPATARLRFCSLGGHLLALGSALCARLRLMNPRSRTCRLRQQPLHPLPASQ